MNSCFEHRCGTAFGLIEPRSQGSKGSGVNSTKLLKIVVPRTGKFEFSPENAGPVETREPPWFLNLPSPLGRQNFGKWFSTRDWFATFISIPPPEPTESPWLEQGGTNANLFQTTL